MSATLWQNATVATLDPARDQAYGLLPQHDILVRDGRIEAIAPSGSLQAEHCIPLDGALITPSLVDCQPI